MALLVEIRGEIFLQDTALIRHPTVQSPDTIHDSLCDLARDLSKKFNQEHHLEDLNNVILLFRQALATALHVPPASFAKLAEALMIRYHTEGELNVGDFEEAVRLYEQASELLSPSHTMRSAISFDLAKALGRRFDDEGELEDLDKAITILRQILEFASPSNPIVFPCSNRLALTLQSRFQETGDAGDCDEAIILHREILQKLGKDHPYRSTSLHNLAALLDSRFSRCNRGGDLEESISLYRESLDLVSVDDNPDLHAACLNNLAMALRSRRVDRKLNGEDLDEAILLHRQAVEVQPSPGTRRASCLEGLAVALRMRYEERHQLGDLEESILIHTQALGQRPGNHRDRPSSLIGLASTLLIRAVQNDGRLDDLDWAISLNRDVLRLETSSQHSQRAARLNLAYAVHKRFLQTHNRVDLDEAISLNRNCLTDIPPADSDRFACLNNLASALRTRFIEDLRREDMDEVVDIYLDLLEESEDDDTTKCIITNNLGKAFIHAWTIMQDPGFVEMALSAFAQGMSCRFAPVLDRFDAARAAATIAAEADYPSTLKAYRLAIELLPQLAVLSLDLQSRQHVLTAGTNGLAVKAAACAIKAGKFEDAVELLEEGRAVFWTQTMRLRTPLDSLHNTSPKLEGKLRGIATALETGSYSEVGVPGDNLSKIAREQDASRLKRLNEDWIETIEEVRSLEGFEDFLLPRRLAALQKASIDAPLVFLIPHEDNSHILIMTTAGVHHIPILHLPVDAIDRLVELIQVARSHSSADAESIIKQTPILSSVSKKLTRYLRDERATRIYSASKMSSNEIFQIVLSVLWDEIGKPVVEHLGLKKSGDLTLVRWCPTGPFTFLPIHAAGHYHMQSNEECIFDYMVSSYTPTVGALLLHDEPLHVAESAKMLVVIQSTTLPGTKLELEKIRTRVPDDYLDVLGTPDAPGRVEETLSCLSTASIAHFACHGVQNPSKPLESALTLEDGQLHAVRIIQQPMPNAAVAFLCACETAMGDKTLPDEPISLGATLLFSGFRSVVATMWSIKDEDGPAVADVFYGELFKGKNEELGTSKSPNFGHSARALQISVRRLCLSNVSFVRWVPFIHLGK